MNAINKNSNLKKNNIPGTLIIRADSNVEIGTGHIMRCLALSQAWCDEGGVVEFVCAELNPAFESRLQKEKIKIQYVTAGIGSEDDVANTIGFARKSGAKWIVLDGYNFGSVYQKRIKDAGLSLLVIDDFGHADYYYADIVLNQNIYADMRYYKRYALNTQFLLGTRYALIRREFIKLKNITRDIPDVARKVLITFGGGDPKNFTIHAIRALKNIPIDNLEVVVIIGGVNPNYNEIIQNCIGSPIFSVRVNVNNMPKLMAWADVAISAGGSTCWELAYMGLPSIISSVSENQILNLIYLNSQGLIKCIKTDEFVQPDNASKIIYNFLMSRIIREHISQNFKGLVDGIGSFRVLMQMEKSILNLRLAEKRDCRSLWKWANDPDVRKSAFCQDPILWKAHKRWFDEKISSPDCIIFILSTKQKRRIGQIRFDIHGELAEVDVSIDKKYRECGVGSYLIREGVKKFFGMTSISHIHAHIKSQNIASISSFKNANFKIIELEEQPTSETIHMIWQVTQQ